MQNQMGESNKLMSEQKPTSITGLCRSESWVRKKGDCYSLICHVYQVVGRRIGESSYWAKGRREKGNAIKKDILAGLYETLNGNGLIMPRCF